MRPCGSPKAYNTASQKLYITKTANSESFLIRVVGDVRFVHLSILLRLQIGNKTTDLYSSESHIP